MKIVGRDKLDVFCKAYADGRRPVEAWLADAAGASWPTPHHVKERYVSASFLSDNKVIFNDKGNDYRLETTVAYRTGVIVVQWIGTHADHDARNRRR